MHWLFTLFFLLRPTCTSWALLVGIRARPTYDVPREITRCSMDYFIASESKPHLAELTYQIGSNARWLSDDQVDSIMEGVIRDFIQGGR